LFALPSGFFSFSCYFIVFGFMKNMKYDKSYKRDIPLEAVVDATLRQALSSKEAQDDLNRIERNVMASVFSRYPKHRKFAYRELLNMYHTPLEVATTEDDNSVYVYLHFLKVDKYILVDRVPKNAKMIELVPDAE
jgi:hypothetical protein